MCPMIRLYSLEPLVCSGVMSAASMVCPSRALTPGERPLQIPYLDGIEIDADPADWGDRGYQIGIMGLFGADHWSLSTEDFLPTVRLGWNERGMLALVHVKTGPPERRSPHMRDCVEMWAGLDGEDRSIYHVTVSPSTDPERGEPIASFLDGRAGIEPRPELALQSAWSSTPDGYVLEVLLPWRNLSISPAVGDEIGFQILVDRIGLGDQTISDGTRGFWCPVPGPTPGAIGSMFPVRLGHTASPPVLAAGAGEYRFRTPCEVGVRALPELIGKTLTVDSQGKQLGSAVIEEAEDGWGRAVVSIPMPRDGRPYVDPALCIDGEPVGTALLEGDPSLAEVKALDAADLRPNRYVFCGPAFPECDFGQPVLAEELIGPYDVKCSYYDSECHPVTSAERPGRYGVVIEAAPRSGRRPIRRFKTLFRQQAPPEWSDAELQPNAGLPEQLGIAPCVAEEQAELVSELLKWSLDGDASRRGLCATILACLYETHASGSITRRDDAYADDVLWWPNDRPNELRPLRYSDVCARDRQWWVCLKRKLYGIDSQYPDPVVCPTRIAGEQSVTVHEGTLSEAGMRPDGIRELDDLLNTWTADSDEGFATCVVRHGVIALHKAYGTRDGRPMTVDTKSRMFSNTKTLSANLMWMLVDQGLVDLDDPVDKYLPALRGIETSEPVTIRRLYNHTWGFMDNGHWGDDVNDLEEVLADYFPLLRVGAEQMYNGVGYAIGGKIIECVSGESLPAFYANHLFEPLGLTGTEATNTSYDAQSIPMDMAKVAQMMLNKGAYGDKRFYSEETFSRMLPEDLYAYIPKGSRTTTTERRFGVGLMRFVGDGHAEGTFGHLAASGATLHIDPANDLVIVMTRSSVGRNYSKYHPRFIQTVLNAIDPGE